MQNKYETLGEIIKNARSTAAMTVEDLANQVGISERFIYRIENEGKKPSYEILYKLIRELAIVPDQIFFPEKQIKDSEMETIICMLHNCDERSMQIIKATIKAALESQPKEKTQPFHGWVFSFQSVNIPGFRTHIFHSNLPGNCFDGSYRRSCLRWCRHVHSPASPRCSQNRTNHPDLHHPNQQR